MNGRDTRQFSQREFIRKVNYGSGLLVLYWLPQRFKQYRDRVNTVNLYFVVFCHSVIRYKTQVSGSPQSPLSSEWISSLRKSTLCPGYLHPLTPLLHSGEPFIRLHSWWRIRSLKSWPISVHPCFCSQSLWTHFCTITQLWFLWNSYVKVTVTWICSWMHCELTCYWHNTFKNRRR